MLLNILTEIAHIFNETAIYILFGFFIAGILKVLVPSDKIYQYFGKGDFTSVLTAALLGIPLPLCSCAVLPTALSLKNQGASKGATLSFLISTPETGVDSISITYALIDPIMTVFRPFAALVTAVSAGLLSNRFDREEVEEHVEPQSCCGPEKTTSIPLTMSSSPETTSCGDTDGGSCGCHEEIETEKGKFHALMHYAFVELLDDIVFWLVIGIIFAGVISALVPVNFFEQHLTGFSSMLVMLVVGIPIYMCAASSTPVAAALMLKGLNPGAALVFLLSGPATNVGTIGAIGKYLGKRTMVIYLGTIVVTSLYLGVLLNVLYESLHINPTAIIGQASELIPHNLKVAGSVVLLFLIIRNILKAGIMNSIHSLHDRFYDLTGIELMKRSEKHKH